MEPTIEQVRQIAKEGGYKRVPVKRELYADRFTTIEAMRSFRKVSNHCFLLESAESDQRWGRYSFLGFNPSLEITCNEGHLKVTRNVEDGDPQITEMEVDHPGEHIRKILAENKSPQLEGFPPFTGGLVGYFSYDYIKYAEPTLKRDDMGHRDFLDMDLMLFDKLVVFDSYRQRVYLIASVEVEGLDESYAKAEHDLDKMERILVSGEHADFEPLKLQKPLELRFSREEFCQMVETAKDHIHEGDIFQVVLSNPMLAPATGSLFDTYRYLRCSNPSPYMFYFTSDDVEIAGASPETLAKLTDGTLYSYPLAGTRPRGKDSAEDARLEAELLMDEKELAEHNMLVDLGRNDLGRISKIGTVKVENYLNILKFSHVMHIGSTVTGQIAEDKDAVDAIDSILPAGTLSGAPKLRACEIIQELEGSKRGIYGGAIGYLDLSGNMDTCIGIRLVYKKNGEICLQSGAGIVADSKPQNEFAECRNKLRAVVEAVEAAEGGLDR
ncbi:MAG: anthranilate synthase component I family protein [Coriobacteriales bacterium]|jgi:anthranilate synthase component 1